LITQPGKPAVEEMDKILYLFPTAFIRMSQQEQQISMHIYHLMAQGKPLSAKLLASSPGLSLELVTRILDGWDGIYYSDAGSIIGYWGLSLSKTKHRFEVDGHGLFTWCAWDALFIPEIIGKPAMVTSVCPVTGCPVQLTVSPDAIESAKPADAVISFIKPEAAKIQESIVTNFCHYVHFFSSENAGQHWVSDNPGTFLLSLDEAFALGHRKNELQYKDTLSMSIFEKRRKT